MEHFGFDPHTAAQLCREKVAVADLFLGLYAHRYGSRPDGFAGKSYVELEYEWATELSTPPTMLIFFVDEKIPWLPKWIDHGDDWERLQQFKRKLRERHLPGKLKTLDKLSSDLFQHLPRFRDEASKAVSLRPPELPVPPDPYVAHEYPLLQTESVIGRAEELTQFDSWIVDPNGARLMSVVAMGGMGKSTLTWRWFHDRVVHVMTPLAGRFWWSFYDEDADFDQFIVVALAYCSKQPINVIEAISPPDRERQLLSLLDRKPYLLVLDGLENLLEAYANPDLAYVNDEDMDRLTHDELAVSVVASDQHRRRRTVDRRAGEFVRKLTCVRKARTLVTTRLLPSELQTATGADLPGSVQWRLPRMRFEDASALWRAMGVSGTDNKLKDLFERIDYYPLLIRLLARAVAEYPHAPGSLEAWQQAHSDFDPFALPLVQSKSHVLANELRGLSRDSRLLLEMVSVFRSPIGYLTLEELFVGFLSWAVEHLDAKLGELEEDRGLLGWDRSLNVYDVHPVVRGVVLQEMRAGNSDSDNLIEAALPFVEMVRIMIGLEKYAAAAQLYVSRLRGGTFSFTEAGMGVTEIALLESFFPSGIEQDPAVEPDDAQGFIAWLGDAYEAAGRLEPALRCATRCVVRLEAGAVPGFLHRYVSERCRVMGQLSQALDSAVLADADGDGVQLALCLATLGQHVAARQTLARQSERYQITQPGASQIYLLAGEYPESVEVGRQFLRGANLWILDRLKTSVDIVEAEIHRGNIDDGSIALEDILREARAKHLIEPELQSLRVLADAHRLRGEYTKARKFLDELAEAAATHGPYRLIQADAANIRALLLDAEPIERGAAAAGAYRLAWCDGPPHAYRRALDRAAATLSELGLPLPDQL